MSKSLPFLDLKNGHDDIKVFDVDMYVNNEIK